jgi:hypothetical protein
MWRPIYQRIATSFALAVANSHILSNLDNIPLPSPETSKSLLMGRNNALKKQLNDLGEALTAAIEEAAKASMPFVKLGPRPKPWWSPDLQILRRDMLHKQRCFVRELARTSQAESFLWKRDYLLARNTYFEAIKRKFDTGQQQV